MTYSHILAKIFYDPYYPLGVSFAENLRKLRKAKGLTQGELAKKVDVSQTAVAHYERGAKKPEMDKLPAIAQALGVTVEALYGLEGGKGNRGMAVADQPHKSRRVVKVQEMYEKLSEAEQRFVLRQIKGLLGQSQK
jgi:transcriptional regulator with XRE-family HTH domain